MGAIHGHIAGDPADVRAAIRAGFDVLDVSDATVQNATQLQRELFDDGSPLGKTDALIAASAREWSGTLATNDRTLSGPVSEYVDVTRYERSDD